MSFSNEMNRYWIPSVDINKKVITSDIQYYLGPESTVRAYTQDGNEGFLITCPGDCLTDEQIDDICRKSKDLWDKQAAAKMKKDSNTQLKRPLHQPVMVSRGGYRKIESSRTSRHSDDRERDRGEGSNSGSERRREDDRSSDGYGRGDR
ncbi:uncharacterized protein RAG0_09223 [Rhynchosporium agropyri]|uniref:Uncharacterized protein n=1 Tax=Rhynchosporium agropyri TaxID=914238 RepID=A0A1E1KUG8_9HELO|nr:uncharacterized protein RAG0_09223 [Rhynchosporium agropyri]